MFIDVVDVLVDDVLVVDVDVVELDVVEVDVVEVVIDEEPVKALAPENFVLIMPILV